MFGGVKVNHVVVQGNLGVGYPCTFELVCAERPAVLDEKEEIAELRARGRSRSKVQDAPISVCAFVGKRRFNRAITKEWPGVV